MKRPNILILMPDQFRADCLSCAGHPVVKTPNLDLLVKDSPWFRRAYTTCPICMPARSSFLTGQFCHNHGQWGNYGSLPSDADAYLHHTRSVGYRTCHIGKSHLSPHRAGHHLSENEDFMHALGFDDVYETTGPHATRRTDSIMTDRWAKLGCLDVFRDDYNKREKHGFLSAVWPSPMPEGETIDDFVGRTAVEYLGNYNRTEPWLVFVGFGGPHEPWDPPAKWAGQYDWRNVDAPSPPLPADSWLPPEAAAHHRRLQSELGIPREVQLKIRALYYAKISHIDDWIGRILSVIRKRGWADHTAVIFWSDHGEMLGDKGRYYKGVFYEESVRVPFLLRLADGSCGGQVQSQPVSLVDAFPTILELAGAKQRPREFGRSLVRFAVDPTTQHHDAVFSEIDGRIMVYDGQYKMVVTSHRTVLKLYDIERDPRETRNLVGLPETEPVVRRLLDRLAHWHLETTTDWRHFMKKGAPDD